MAKTARTEETHGDRGAPPPCQLMDVASLLESAISVDLYIHYHAEPTRQLPALGRSACGPASPCEPSRLREGYCLKPVKVEKTEAEVQPWVQTQQEYTDHMETARAFARGIFEPDIFAPLNPAHLRDRLKRWLEAHPVQQFGFLRAWWDNLEDTDLVYNDQLCEPSLSQALFWLTLDYSLSWAKCACPACESTQGVPLARLRIARLVTNGSLACHVVEVNSWPPYRQPLAPDLCGPVQPGCVSLLSWLWKPLDDVLAELVTHRIAVNLEPFVLQSWGGLQRMFAFTRTEACPGSSVTALIYDEQGPGKERVIGFM